MGGLPRPELPPGARRDLSERLHALHHQAGWPSLRALAREAGCSHTTVSTVFSSPRPPSWGMLELVVEAMGGDTEEFRRLWVAATGSAARAQVVGEAGIGGSRAVETAQSQRPEVLVATGARLPLSTQVPLLPLTDALRQLFEAVGAVLSVLAAARPTAVVLEDLHRADPTTPAVTDDWRGRLQRLRAVTTIRLEPLTRDEPTGRKTVPRP